MLSTLYLCRFSAGCRFTPWSYAAVVLKRETDVLEDMDQRNTPAEKKKSLYMGRPAVIAHQSMLLELISRCSRNSTQATRNKSKDGVHSPDF
jgi:hypothetical protein